jgi:hypothetical protein
MAAVTVATSVGMWGAGFAAAASAKVTLHYTCVLSPFPGEAMTAQLAWNAPGSVMVGRTIPTFTLNAQATVSPTVTWALGLVGAATVEGSVDAPGIVDAPEGNISAAVRLTVPRTDVPASGPITVRATGTASGLVFHQPGHAEITAGNELAMHFIPKDASGNPTPAGEVDLSCTLDPGQNPVVFSFEITPARAATPTTGIAGQATSPTGGLTGTGTPGPSESVSGTEHSTATATVTPTAQRWWLAGAGILTAVAGVIGCLWWLRRRRKT